MLETKQQTENVRGSERCPCVSVIIPAYNAAAYIGEALTSVFEQTLAGYEVIVINDGSPDTEELEQELEPYRSRIVYLRQENHGAAAARNAGLRAARGEFVAFLDADDRWLSSYLEDQIDFLKRSTADLVYADALLFGDSHLAGRTFMEMAPSRGAVTPESLLAVNVGILTSAVLARKKSVFEVGLFDEAIRRGQDFDLWLRLAKHGVKFAYQRKVLLHHRVLESGLSGNTLSQLERTLTLLETIRMRGNLTPGEEAALTLSMNRTQAGLALEKGKARLLEKDFGGAIESFNQAKRFRPSWKLALVCFGLQMAPELFWRMYRARSTVAS